VKLLLAQVHVEADSPDQAIALYDETIEAVPDDFRPVLAKALVLQEQGDTNTAQALFTQATALAPAQFKDQIELMSSQGQAAPGASSETTDAVEPAPAAEEPAE
jgi:tetratricopeptide (TPR) repeat protein